MSFRSKRIALWAIVAVAGSLFAQALWIPTARAQSAATESGQVVQVPVSQLEQIEKELQYLRRARRREASLGSVGRSATANQRHDAGHHRDHVVRRDRRPTPKLGPLPASALPATLPAVWAPQMAAVVPTACHRGCAVCRLPASHHSRSMGQRQGFRGGQAGRHLQHGASPGARCPIFSGSGLCRRISDEHH